MKKFLIAASSLLLALQSTAAPAQTLIADKTVRDVHANADLACVFFHLDGYSTWFAVPRTHINFQELFAILLTARVQQLQVDIYLTGTTACGYTGVSAVVIND